MKIARHFLTHPFISLLAVAVIVGGGYFYFGRSADDSAYDYYEVERRDLVQEVSVTGRVEPVDDVDLAFEKSGKVGAIYVKIGDKVQIGRILVSLDGSELFTQLAKEEANVKVQEAKLNELRSGTRPEEIKIQEVKVANAQVSLEDARKNLVDKIQDAYTKSDDAIRNKTDQYFVNLKSTSPKIVFSIYDSSLKTTLEDSRLNIENRLASWKTSLQNLTILSDLDAYTNITEQNLNYLKTFFANATLALNDLTPSGTLTQTNIDAYRADTSTARTNTNTATTNLTTAEEKLRTAESTLTLEQNELLLDKAGAVPEQIAAQVAQVESAKAQVSNIQAQISKTIIKSPIDGVIIKQDAKVGEIISANTTIISVISNDKFQMKANIPEADIAKIKVGDIAKVTLDAYGSDVIFDAKVTVIDPAETMIEGVATYETTFQFVRADERIRSGMTANIDITVDSRKNVLAAPQRFIKTSNRDKVVMLERTSGALEEDWEIRTGLRSSDGYIEILSGLKEGDRIAAEK